MVLWTKFKARLVAKGYSQKADIDYTETFSPVIRFDTIRVMLSVAAKEKLHLAQFDIKTAFLYGELEETIYMRQPEGFEDGTARVCKLNKSLYGLKQSPRCWNKRFKSFLDKHGLIQSAADPCLFISMTKGHKLMVALYVDDGLVACQDKDDLTRFLTELKSEFKVTVSDALCFLGLQIIQREDGSVVVSQANYARRLLHKFNMSDCNPVATPIDKGHDSGEADDVIISEKVPYREAVGSLMYLVTGTRPDLAYAVSVVSRSLDKPSSRDWEKVKRIFRYLKGTVSMAILYRSDVEADVLLAYSDADYAGDIESRRSTSGVICQYMGGPITWLSQRQKCVALSTTEAEFIAANEAAKELTWLSRLLHEITVLTEIPLLRVDNLSALKLVKNPIFHKRSKHIDVRYFFIRDKIEDGTLVIEHVASEEQIADIFTKPLAKDRFQKLRSLLSVNAIA
jgi:hypothetical protein